MVICGFFCVILTQDHASGVVVIHAWTRMELGVDQFPGYELFLNLDYKALSYLVSFNCYTRRVSETIGKLTPYIMNLVKIFIIPGVCSKVLPYHKIIKRIGYF